MLRFVSLFLLFAVILVSSKKKQYQTYCESPKPCKGRQTYMFKFMGTWSRSRQPLNYPSTPLPIDALGNPTAIFSPAVVVSHSSDVQLFKVGEVATLPGLEQVAETGGTDIINASLVTLQGQGKVYDISISGTPSDSNGGTQVVKITVTRQQPLVSMVTMLFPSPDWITAVTNVNMCDPQGFWKSKFKSEFLQVYDVGTDSGTTFTSGDVDTQPRMPVSVLSCGANFCDGNGAIPSVGTASLVGVKKVNRKKSSGKSSENSGEKSKQKNKRKSDRKSKQKSSERKSKRKHGKKKHTWRVSKSKSVGSSDDDGH